MVVAGVTEICWTFVPLHAFDKNRKTFNSNGFPFMTSPCIEAVKQV